MILGIFDSMTDGWARCAGKEPELADGEKKKEDDDDGQGKQQRFEYTHLGVRMQNKRTALSSTMLLLETLSHAVDMQKIYT